MLRSLVDPKGCEETTSGEYIKSSQGVLVPALVERI